MLIFSLPIKEEDWAKKCLDESVLLSTLERIYARRDGVRAKLLNTGKDDERESFGVASMVKEVIYVDVNIR
jgi:hypothetical protein